MTGTQVRGVVRSTMDLVTWTHVVLDPAASARAGRGHEARHRDCAAVVDRLRSVLAGPELVPAAPGVGERLWWATGTPSAVDAAADGGPAAGSGADG